MTDGENGYIYYYNINKYFNNDIYNSYGIQWITDKNIMQNCYSGVIPDGLISDDDIVSLLQSNLIKKTNKGLNVNFAIYSREQFEKFSEKFKLNDEEINKLLTDLILSIHNAFKSFVPKRLNNQINQWVSCFVHSICGYDTEELIKRGVLEKPSDEEPLTNGVFYIKGKYINV